MIPYLLYALILVALYPRARKSKWFRLSMFLTTILFVGLRKDVGTDYENYADYFEMYADFFEIGYTTLALFLRTQGYDVMCLFFIMAALSYGVLYLAVELNDDIDKGSTSLLLCLLTITFSVNGIRQFLAAALFMLSYCFIKNRKLPLFLTCIGMGFLFHKSIIILIPFYFISNRYFSSIVYYCIYLFSFIVTTMSLQELMGPVAGFLSDNDPRYYKYLSRDAYNSSYFSLGIFVELLNYIVLFVISIKFKIYKEYPIIFNLFLTMVIIYNMRIASPLFNRVQVYFTMYTYYLLPLVIKRIKSNTGQLATLFYIITIGGMSIKYIFFTPESRMAVYHDVFGIF